MSVGQRQSKFTVALVGAPKAGKTALTCRFMDRQHVFVDTYEATIEDSYMQLMHMIDPSDGLERAVTLEIKDIGHAMLDPKMLENCDAFLFCFDLTNMESFYSLSELFQMKLEIDLFGENGSNEDIGGGGGDMQAASMNTLSMAKKPSSNPDQHNYNDDNSEENQKPVVLVGCKNDLREARQIEYTDGERTAEAFSAPYTECSAKLNKGVEEVFELILIQLFKKEKKKRDSLML